VLQGPGHPVWAHSRDGAAPELLFAESAKALVLYVRAGTLTPVQAARGLSFVFSSGITFEPLRALVLPALECSIRHGISAYDAFYLALAEQAGALLVTADRRLAELATRSELVP
jgi:predicted nucleic acid-binding protein